MSRKPPAGSVALVTGATSGIGAATASRLAQAGATVLLHGRERARLAELARRTGGTALPAELTDPAAIDDLAATALRTAGRVDVLVNNAGLGWAGPLAQMSAARVDELVSVNLLAPIRLTQALLPQMLRLGSGYVVFVSSIAGRTGVTGEAVYAATKAGLDGFAESLRAELDGTGVGVGVVVPGVVRTAFFERRGQPYTRTRPRPVSPETVAEAVLRLVSGGACERYVPGWLRLPVGLRAVAPGLYRSLARRFGTQS